MEVVSLHSVYSVDPDTQTGYDIRALECFSVKFRLGVIMDNFGAVLYSSSCTVVQYRGESPLVTRSWFGLAGLGRSSVCHEF